METLQQTLGQLAELQVANQRQLNQLSSRVDSFVFEAQRLFTKIGETSERNEAAVESLTESVGRLTRNSEADRVESAAFRTEMSSMVSRLDALVNYLMRQK
jgi:hypothetical protein